MKRLLISATLLLVIALLLGGLYFQANPLMWIASTSLDYAYIRGAMIAALAVLLLSRPPRRLAVRLIMMGFALGLASTTIIMTFSYSMHLLDAVVFMEVAIILAIEALEVSWASTRPSLYWRLKPARKKQLAESV